VIKFHSKSQAANFAANVLPIALALVVVVVWSSTFNELLSEAAAVTVTSGACATEGPINTPSFTSSERSSESRSRAWTPKYVKNRQGYSIMYYSLEHTNIATFEISAERKNIEIGDASVSLNTVLDNTIANINAYYVVAYFESLVEITSE
jgi:hypothetical protein